MRNMSFMLTTKQVRDGTKTVTRRPGWKFLKPGDRVMACVKCQGLGAGGKIERIREIEILSNRREPLATMLDFPRQYLYAQEEMIREGFPGRDPAEFALMFCKMYKGMTLLIPISRIAFKYVEGVQP